MGDNLYFNELMGLRWGAVSSSTILTRSMFNSVRFVEAPKSLLAHSALMVNLSRYNSFKFGGKVGFDIMTCSFAPPSCRNVKEDNLQKKELFQIRFQS